MQHDGGATGINVTALVRLQRRPRWRLSHQNLFASIAAIHHGVLEPAAQYCAQHRDICRIGAVQLIAGHGYRIEPRLEVEQALIEGCRQAGCLALQVRPGVGIELECDLMVCDGRHQ